MIASLPMYWRVETAETWHAFWDLVRANAPDLPDLTAPDDLPADWTRHWLAPDLALSMTCGLPLRTVLKHKVTYVGTLDFGFGGPSGFYHSCIIRRKDLATDAAGLRLAFNMPDSQSGWAAVHDHGPQNPPQEIIGYVKTGSHAGSLAAVAEGRADVAFLDSVTWRLLSAHDPNAARVIVAGQTPERPGLPLITALGRDPVPLQTAIAEAVRRLTGLQRATLGGLQGITVLDEALYHAQPVPPAPPIA